MSVNDSDVMRQSKAAYGQWCKQWREHAKHNSKHKILDMVDFQNVGIGKACLVVANGSSMEGQIETIKKYQDQVDILCCDKTLIHLIKNGIKPTYCIVADANVSDEAYLEPVKDQLADVILFSNVCGNITWPEKGNWKAVYFHVFKDCLGSEKEFQALSGCPNVIAAPTNVSNAMIVILTQCDNDGKRNFFGYDKIICSGYDYCWDENTYYAFDSDGGGKRNYMRNVHIFNCDGDLCYTSTNLLFSAKWLSTYVKSYDIACIQTTKKSLFRGKVFADLAEQMQYSYKPEDSQEVARLVDYRRKLLSEIKAAETNMFNIGRDHYRSMIRTT